jgi:Na+/H+ antiporter NhaC
MEPRPVPYTFLSFLIASILVLFLFFFLDFNDLLCNIVLDSQREGGEEEKERRSGSAT